MPIYVYRCDGCCEVFELIQKFSDEPLKVHEKCGAPVHRMITSSAIQFKGSGWYATDYAKGAGNGGSKKSDSEKSEKKESGDTSSKTESKSGESKPAASDKPPFKKSSD